MRFTLRTMILLTVVASFAFATVYKRDALRAQLIADIVESGGGAHKETHWAFYVFPNESVTRVTLPYRSMQDYPLTKLRSFSHLKEVRILDYFIYSDGMGRVYGDVTVSVSEYDRYFIDLDTGERFD